MFGGLGSWGLGLRGGMVFRVGVKGLGLRV